MSSGEIHALFVELVSETRRAQAATARFDRAVADAVGLNLTDMACLDAISQIGPLTAGQLAQRTGLSSGAMTTAIDRLERAGYARRTEDPRDRRRVLVELTEAAADLDAYYLEHMRLAEQLRLHYSPEEMRLLLGFARKSREFNERRAAELEQQTRRRKGFPVEREASQGA